MRRAGWQGTRSVPCGPVRARDAHVPWCGTSPVLLPPLSQHTLTFRIERKSREIFFFFVSQMGKEKIPVHMQPLLNLCFSFISASYFLDLSWTRSGITELMPCKRVSCVTYYSPEVLHIRWENLFFCISKLSSKCKCLVWFQWVVYKSCPLSAFSPMQSEGVWIAATVWTEGFSM